MLFNDAPTIALMINKNFEEKGPHPYSVQVQDQRTASEVIRLFSAVAKANTVVMWSNEISKEAYERGLGNPGQRALYEHWHSHDCNRLCPDYLRLERMC